MHVFNKTLTIVYDSENIYKLVREKTKRKQQILGIISPNKAIYSDAIHGFGFCFSFGIHL